MKKTIVLIVIAVLTISPQAFANLSGKAGQETVKLNRATLSALPKNDAATLKNEEIKSDGFANGRSQSECLKSAFLR